MRSDEKETLAGQDAAAADSLIREINLLRKAVLRQGHAQELFQARVDEAVERLARGAGTGRPLPPAGPSSAQVRALLELDQAVLRLLRLAQEERAAASEEAVEEAPRSLREGLSLLHVRVRNLQHSLGLEAIPAHDVAFDDRWHEAYGIAVCPDLPDGWVVEEVLPGYRLGERVVRPARVIVNRRT